MCHSLSECLTGRSPAVPYPSRWSWLLGRGERLRSLGPEVVYWLAILLAQQGRLVEAVNVLGQSHQDEFSLWLHCHLLQLLGDWDASGAILKEKKDGAGPWLLLTERQASHDEGKASNEYVLLRCNGPHSEILAPYFFHAQITFLGENLEEKKTDYEGLSSKEALVAFRFGISASVLEKAHEKLAVYIDHPVFQWLSLPEREFFIGVRYWWENQPAEAELILARSIENGPAFTPSRKALMALFFEMRAFAKASALARALIRERPDDTQLALYSCLAQFHADPNPESTLRLKLLQKRHPSDNRPSRSLVHHFIRQGMVAWRNNDSTAKDHAFSRAASQLETKANLIEGPWLKWAIDILSMPWSKIHGRLDDIIRAEPEISSDFPCPSWVACLRGVLRVMTMSTTDSLEGWRLVLDNWPGADHGQTDWLCDVYRYLTQLPLEDEQAVELLTLAEASVHAVLKPLNQIYRKRLELDGAWRDCDIESHQPHSALAAKALRFLDQTEKMEEIFEEGLKFEGIGQESVQLVTAILSAHLKQDEAALERLNGRKDPAALFLQATLQAHRNDKKQKDHLVQTLLELFRCPTFEGTQPHLAGALAVLIMRGRGEENLANVESLLTELANRLSTLPMNCALVAFHGLLLLDKRDQAEILCRKSSGAVRKEMESTLQAIARAEAAACVETDDLKRALQLLELLRFDGDGDSEISNLISLLKERRALQLLLQNLSPHETLTASPVRFACLNVCARNVDAPKIMKQSLNIEQNRQRLRNRVIQSIFLLPEVECMDCLHALAVLHQEWGTMTASEHLDEQSTSCFHYANFFWRHLFIRDNFWPTLAKRYELDVDQVDELRERVETEIVNVHSEQARLLLTSDRAELAAMHLGCLWGWDSTPARGYAQEPRDYPGRSNQPGAGRMGEMQERAWKAYDEWVDDIKYRATQARDHSDRLPEGMSRNYEAGIKIIKTAIARVPEDQHLSVFLIDQLNKYAWECHLNENHVKARCLVEEALPRARMIANAYFKPGELSGAQGRDLMQAFNYAWQIEDDEDEKIKRIDEFLSWNGPDAIAEKERSLLIARQSLSRKTPQKGLLELGEICMENVDEGEWFHLDSLQFQLQMMAWNQLIEDTLQEPNSYWDAELKYQHEIIDRIADSMRNALDAAERMINQGAENHLDPDSRKYLLEQEERLRDLVASLPWSAARMLVISAINSGHDHCLQKAAILLEGFDPENQIREHDELLALCRLRFRD